MNTIEYFKEQFDQLQSADKNNQLAYYPAECISMLSVKWVFRLPDMKNGNIPASAVCLIKNISFLRKLMHSFSYGGVESYSFAGS